MKKQLFFTVFIFLFITFGFAIMVTSNIFIVIFSVLIPFVALYGLKILNK